MADSRIPALSEVLAAELASLYDSLVIPIDDPSYSAGDLKKIKAKTLLQTVNDSITTINSTLTNKADKSNVIEKNTTTAYTPSLDYHPVNVKYFKEHSTALSFDLTGTWASFTINHIAGRRSGNRFSINCRVLSVSSTTSNRLVGKINGYVSPGYVHYFSCCCTEPGIYESANGYVNTDGSIYLKTGKSNKQFVFDTCIIS